MPAIAEAGIYALFGVANAGSPQTYVNVANVIGEIGGIGGSAKMEDVTPHGPSPWSVMFPTLMTFGPVTIELAFIASADGVGGHSFTSGLGSYWANQTFADYRVTWPDGRLLYFGAYISKFDIKAPVNGVITAAVTFETTGEPILA